MPYALPSRPEGRGIRAEALVTENFDSVAHNRAAWDREVESGNEWSRPVGSDVIARARAGDWSVVLIGYQPVPRDWFRASWPARRCCAWPPAAASRARCSRRRARP
jgi:hypothetical protein